MKKDEWIFTAVMLAFLCAVIIVDIFVSPFWGMFLNWLLMFAAFMFVSHENRKLAKELEKAERTIKALIWSHKLEDITEEDLHLTLYPGDEFNNEKDGKDSGISEN